MRLTGRIAARVAAATAVAALLGTGTMYLVAHNGTVGGGSEPLLTPEGLIACARAVAEGTIERVEPLGGDEYRVVLDADRYYKPADGQGRLTFDTGWSPHPDYFKAGERMLVVVSSLPDEGPETYRESDAGELERGRQWIQAALPGSRGATCDGPG